VTRTIALTGATGFVGSAVVDRLLRERDLELRCLVRAESDPRDLEKRGPRVSVHLGDVTRPETLQGCFDGAWGVVNLAGHRDFWSPSRDDYDALNARGAEHVFRAALAAGCSKVVQVSTPLAFGLPADCPFDESSPPGPHSSDYARSKHRGDEVGWRLHRECGLPLTIVHLAAVLGAGDPRPTMEVRRAVEGRLPVLVGADKTFTYVYIRDAAEAIARALLREGTVGRAYLVGRERATTRAYFATIADLAGVPAPTWSVPEAVVLPMARLLGLVSRWSGARPAVPPDIIETTAAGSLLFRADRSERELGLEYTPLRTALAEAVDEILSEIRGEPTVDR